MIGVLLVCFRYRALEAAEPLPTWVEGLADFSVLKPEILSRA